MIPTCLARVSWRLLASFCLVTLIGCQTSNQLTSSPHSAGKASQQRLVATWPNASRPGAVAAERSGAVDDALGDDLWQRIRNGYQLQHSTAQQARIGQHLQYYQRHPGYFQQTAPRAERYLHYVVEQLAERQMPKELALLPFIESAYNPQANSHAQAAGIWQFIPSTGRHFNLQQNWWYDGRRDITASTQAALDYLTQLNTRFDGDWLLALAAYNCGGGCVSRAITRNQQQGLATDYWSLRLPQETMHYVPKLLAMAQVVRDPESYGIALPVLSNTPYFARIELDKQIDLDKAAELAGLSLEELRQLNPAYKQRITPPRDAYTLLLPVDKATPFISTLDALPQSEWVDYQPYRVRRGDNLSQIAQRHQVSVPAIRDINNLRNNMIRAGQTLMLPTPATEASRTQQVADSDNGKQRKYTVRSGDNLWAIARRFNLDVDSIRSWNTLGRHLQPGQELTLYLP